MKYFAVLSLVALTVAAVRCRLDGSTPSGISTGTVQMTYDNAYDDPYGTINSVACSNGANGLNTKYGWTTFSQIPAFSHIGGSFQISYNSPNCGKCYKLTNPSNGKSVNMLGVDYAGKGFNVATSVFEALVGSTAPGNVQVNWQVAPDWHCGGPKDLNVAQA